MAAGEALAKSAEKNRMEQEEIAIQIDAAKRFLALYDSKRSSASAAAGTHAEDAPSTARSTARNSGQGGDLKPQAPAPAPPAPPRRSSSSTNIDNISSNNTSYPSAGVSSIPSPPPSSSRPRVSSQLPPTPPPSARVGILPENSWPPPRPPPPPSLGPSPSLSRVRSSESTGTHGERGGAVAAVRGRGSGAWLSSLGVLGNASGGGRGSAKAPRELPLEAGAGRGGKTSNRKAAAPAAPATAQAARSVVTVKSSIRREAASSSSSGDDDDDVVGGVGRNGKSLYGFITSMPPAGGSRKHAAADASADARKPPPADVDAGDDFPTSVPSDTGGVGSELTGVRGGGAGEASHREARRGDGTRRGVEVNTGSFNVRKQLMFKTTR